MAAENRARSKVLPTAPLLMTESKDEFTRICDALNDEIRPRGIIEEMYVADIACLVWEALRLRRSKVAMMNSGFRTALTQIIGQMQKESGVWRGMLEKSGDEQLALAWFCDQRAKTQVAELLEKFGLDESAIEAEAFRKAADDIERIDHLLALAEARRDRALNSIAHYRGDFGARLRESSDRLAKGKILKLENAGGKERKSVA